MKKTILAAVSATAIVALGACTEETTTEETTIVEDEGMEAPDPMMAAPVEDDGDSVSISEDGVNAEINDGDTSVNADMDDDPSLEVEVD